MAEHVGVQPLGSERQVTCLERVSDLSGRDVVKFEKMVVGVQSLNGTIFSVKMYLGKDCPILLLVPVLLVPSIDDDVVGSLDFIPFIPS